MKNFWILSVLWICCLSMAFGQASFEYTIRVQDKSTPQSDIKVWMRETGSGETITKRTDSRGQVIFNLTEGQWTLNLVGLPNHREVNVRKNSQGSGSATVSYNEAEALDELRIMRERKVTVFADIDQSDVSADRPGRGTCIYKIIVKDKGGRPVKGVAAAMLSTKTKKRYVRESDNRGVARFQLPINDRYAIDLAGIPNFTFTRKITREGVYSMTETFVATNINETEQNDTITQKGVTASSQPTTQRVHAKITVREKGTPAAKLPVFLTNLHTNKVFKGKTNANGEVYFLLPKGVKYLLHFPYHHDVDVISLTKVKGLGNYQASFNYKPDPRLQFPERYLPTPETVFIKEFQNFISHQLPEPETGKVGISLDWGNDAVGPDSKEAVLQVGIRGTDNGDRFESPVDVDLALVLDRSGSMAGYGRIEALQQAMLKFSEELGPRNRISLVTFNDKASVDLPLQKGGKSKFITRVEELEPSGGTNIYNGMLAGFEELVRHKSADHSKHLILVTDGYGETPPKHVVEKAAEYMDQGISISAVGVGDSYNYALLDLLTRERGTLLSHVDSDEQAMVQAFSDQLSEVTHPIGKKATVEIVYNDKVQFKKLLGAPVTSNAKGMARVKLGEISRGYNKVALVQFDLNQPDKSIEHQPVIIRLKYTDLETGQQEVVEEKATLRWEPASGKYEMLLEREEKKLWAIAIMNQSIKVMLEELADQDYKGANQALTSCADQVSEIFPGAQDEDVVKLLNEMTLYVKAIDATIKKNMN